MTNEKKAEKIVNSIFSLGLNANNTFYDMAINAAIEMAEWKDSQPQIIEIFGKRVKIVEDESKGDSCFDCALLFSCRAKWAICKKSDHKFNQHFVEVDEDGNEIGGDK